MSELDHELPTRPRPLGVGFAPDNGHASGP
jgi:hypothetical protein